MVLSVILTILKILGILILVIFGILLAVILLVLLVPVRYSAQGSYYGKLKGTAKVTWLLHILSVKVAYDEKAEVSVRIFGVPLGKSNKKRRFRKRKDENEDGLETVLYPDEDEMLTVQELPRQEEVLESEPIAEPAIKPEPEKKESKTDSLLKRIQDKRKGFYRKLKFSFRQFCAKLKDGKAAIAAAQAWWKDEKNKKLIKLILRQIKKLLKHILPRKAKGKVKFGFDDPYITGQVLSYLSLIWPLCHKKLELCPVFGVDGAVFEGEGYLKGRVRVGTILWLAARLLFNKEFRTLLKKFLG